MVEPGRSQVAIRRPGPGDQSGDLCFGRPLWARLVGQNDPIEPTKLGGEFYSCIVDVDNPIGEPPTSNAGIDQTL